MASYYDTITSEQAALIAAAPLFFVASADPSLEAGPHGIGPVNLSPKGGVPLHIISPTRVAYLDYKGSGNETARHLGAGGPVTLMVCSFAAEDAAIVRLYGRARVVPLEKSPLAELLLASPAADLRLPLRQVVDVAVERTATSCGYGVPVLAPVRERTVGDRGRRYKEPR
ncbi:MAG TPA: pyridoxamine 5'-phosphate oxidase family protein [Chloroflexaceae bacterium]|nr:pyridoxamine 5'-phosphate oxidase family protein [Chloroflexaceae bacterium]